jgi:Fe2+ transport system protein FeoA
MKTDLNTIFQLIDAPPDQLLRVKNFSGPSGIEHKLRQLGIKPGDCIEVLRRAPFEGPLLIRVRNREIALGIGVASKIMVEVDACDLP